MTATTYGDWFSQAWDAAEKAGRCPVCATGNSHTASRCPEGAWVEAAKEAFDLGIKERSPRAATVGALKVHRAIVQGCAATKPRRWWQRYRARHAAK